MSGVLSPSGISPPGSQGCEGQVCVHIRVTLKQLQLGCLCDFYFSSCGNKNVAPFIFHSI